MGSVGPVVVKVSPLLVSPVIDWFTLSHVTLLMFPCSTSLVNFEKAIGSVALEENERALTTTRPTTAITTHTNQVGSPFSPRPRDFPEGGAEPSFWSKGMVHRLGAWPDNSHALADPTLRERSTIPVATRSAARIPCDP